MTLLYWLYCFSAVSIASGFAPATYPAQILAECSTGELLVDKELIKKTLSSSSSSWVLQAVTLPGTGLVRTFSTASHQLLRLLPDNCFQWLTSAGLLWHGGNQLRRRGRLDKGGMSLSSTTCPQELTQRLLNGITTVAGVSLLDVKALSSLLMVSATPVCVDG